MQKYLLSALLIVIFLFAGCAEKEEESAAQQHPGVHNVIIKEKMNASSYSYLLVEENNVEYWIAVPQMEIETGERLIFTKSLEMLNFNSPTLDKTFDRILFVEDPVKSQNMQSIPVPHTQVKASAKQNVKVTPLSGGKTIGEIFAEKNKLNGKTVRIRGVVTRFNEEIMDRNWIHLQDGTGTDEDFDLMVTSLDRTGVGQEIVVEGTVVLDKDFGAGYSYSVMLENAKIISE